MSLPRIVGRPGDARSVIGDPWWVLSRRAGPFPLVEVRDLLGIVRALYRSGREDNAGAAYLERLERIGRKLQLAIELAAAGPDTVGERAAFNHAEEACEELGRAVESFLPVDKVVASASRAVTRAGRPALRKKHEER